MDDEERARIIEQAYSHIASREADAAALEQRSRSLLECPPSDSLEEWRRRAAERAARQRQRNNKTDITRNSAAAMMVYKDFWSHAQPAEPERERMGAENSAAWNKWAPDTARAEIRTLELVCAEYMRCFDDVKRALTELHTRIAVLEQKQKQRRR